jgi:hypothetical protein
MVRPQKEPLFRKEEVMCDSSSACGCGPASAASAVSDIGAGIIKGVFGVIGGCVALTLIVGVVRMVLPWLAGGLAAVFAVTCGTAVVVTVRRRRRLRGVIPAPIDAAPRTTVEAVTVRAIEPGSRRTMQNAPATRGPGQRVGGSECRTRPL